MDQDTLKQWAGIVILVMIAFFVSVGVLGVLSHAFAPKCTAYKFPDNHQITGSYVIWLDDGITHKRSVEEFCISYD